MQITSILAIYFLFWVMSAFIMLPFGVRTADEAGVEKVPGQADSAPVNFRPGRLALRATVVAAVLTALFIANFTYGWITAADIDFLPKPPAGAAPAG
jgi:predicted secreted protein